METSALTIFHQTVRYENENIWVKPVCDFFNLSVQFQQRKLKSDKILGKLWTKKYTDLGKIDANGRVLLSKKGFIRWIQIINPNTIDEKLRSSFLTYQELIFDFLIGSAEEQKLIGELNASLQFMKLDYSRLGNEIKKTQRELIKALNKRYQYSISFEQRNELAALH